MKLTEEIKRIRMIMSVINENNGGEKTLCPKCNHSWTIGKSDPDPYLCHICGYDQLSGEYEFDKLSKWQKDNNINENEDEDEDEDYGEYYGSNREDLAQLKKDLINLGVNKNTRLHLTHDNDLKKVDTPQVSEGPKPKGLWYAVGFGWLDFTTNDFTSFYEEDEVSAFEISLEGLNVLKITNYEELVEFQKIYLAQTSDYRRMSNYDINWAKVAENYDGIEIAPYIYKARYEHQWYYGWDVASGCIWNTSKLKYKLLLRK